MAMLECSRCACLRAAAVPVASPVCAAVADRVGVRAGSGHSSLLSTSGRGLDARRGGDWTRARTASSRRRGEVGRRTTISARARGGRNQSSPEESKAVYDAFFLGRALAETINERVGSAVGEFLSDVGRRQAEQRKRIRKFQDEVQQRAAAEAVKAAQKALSIEKEKKKYETPPTAPPPPSPSPKQPPPSTSGLSNPDNL